MSWTDKDMNNLNIPSVIPVDESYGRVQFALDDEEDASSIYTVASSTYNFRMEHGRRYYDYRDGHPFPYDEVSEENEITMHHMMLLLLDNKYYLSPVPESSLGCVADVGTGLGLWAEGVAERYPNTKVVGIDKAPHERPIFPNCSYILADATDEWILDVPSMKFDLVYIRSLFGVKDWPALYKQCFENMNSGGWIEHLEFEIDAQCDDNSVPPDSKVKELCTYTNQMGLASGRDLHVSRSMKQMIEEAGFVEVREEKIKLPIGSWATDPKMKDVGRFFERYYKTGLQGWLLQICTRTMGWTVGQVDDACLQAFREINSRQQHIYYPLVIVIGRKP